jgi:hypothetical protein
MESSTFRPRQSCKLLIFFLDFLPSEILISPSAPTSSSYTSSSISSSSSSTTSATAIAASAASLYYPGSDVFSAVKPVSWIRRRESGIFPNSTTSSTLGRTLSNTSELVQLPGNNSQAAQALAWTRSDGNSNVTILNQMYV